MSGLVEWLKAQLDADEQLAKAAADDGRGYGIAYDEPVHWLNSDSSVHTDGGSGAAIAVGGYGCGVGDAVADHMARWDPQGVLDDIAAKRRQIGNHKADDKGCCRTCAHWTSDWVDGFKVDRLAYEGVTAPCLTLRLLALPYADRPGYDESWKP